MPILDASLDMDDTGDDDDTSQKERLWYTLLNREEMYTVRAWCVRGVCAPRRRMLTANVV